MQLLKKKVQIDETQFLALIEAKKSSFYRVAYSYTNHREDALDVVSEAVCKAFMNLNNLKDPDAFYPWFYRILANTAISFLRVRNRFTSLEDWEEPVDSSDHTTDILAVREELNRLDQTYREILLLKCSDGLTFREIAALTGRKESTVKTTYYRGIELLKERMNPHGTTQL